MTSPAELVRALYLSPTTAPQVMANLDAFGFLASPRTGLRTAVTEGAWWAMDNDCFNNGGELDGEAWTAALRAHHPYRERCLFVAVPDVPYNAAGTLERFAHYADILHAAEFPVALVTQNGMLVDEIPWDALDALFIGGDDEHKLHGAGHRLLMAARRRGKWAHVGRVNSASRMLRFWRADSWDGTTISREPERAVAIAVAVREIRAMQKARKLWQADELDG